MKRFLLLVMLFSINQSFTIENQDAAYLIGLTGWLTCNTIRAGCFLAASDCIAAEIAKAYGDDATVRSMCFTATDLVLLTGWHVFDTKCYPSTHQNKKKK